MSLDDVVAATRQAALAPPHPQQYRVCDFLGWIKTIALMGSLGQDVRDAAAEEAEAAVDYFHLDHVGVPPVSAARAASMAEAFNGVVDDAERDRHAGVWLARFIAEMYTLY